MGIAWNIVFMPGLIVIAGLFWGCVGLLLANTYETWRYRRKHRTVRR